MSGVQLYYNIGLSSATIMLISGYMLDKYSNNGLGFFDIPLSFDQKVRAIDTLLRNWNQISTIVILKIIIIIAMGYNFLCSGLSNEFLFCHAPFNDKCSHVKNKKKK